MLKNLANMSKQGVEQGSHLTLHRFSSSLSFHSWKYNSLIFLIAPSRLKWVKHQDKHNKIIFQEKILHTHLLVISKNSNSKIKKKLPTILAFPKHDCL